jgi:hypothetical protein
MNRFTLGLTALLVSGVLSTSAQAGDALPASAWLLAQSPTGSTSNPYNSPIRRANPNSMQGTQPNAPVIRGPNTVPTPRPSTIDNGGIGNRYPQNKSAPASPPTFIPNPPPRDSGSNTR